MANKDRHNKMLGLSIAASILLGSVGAYKDKYDHKAELPQGIITKCDNPGTGGYFISSDKYPYSRAEAACTALGGYMADVTNENFLLITDLLTTCAGPNKNAWIGSWDHADGNSENQDCMSVTVGMIGPGGGIEQSCAGDKRVICQLRSSSTPHNPSYSEVAPSGEQSVGGARPTDIVGASRPRPYPYPQPYPYPYPYPYNGGYPGGVFPGGPGYGNGGYPFGYPGKNKDWHHKEHHGDATTIRETVTVQGYVTTLTVNGVERTITLAQPTTVIVPGEPLTVTRDGLPVTITATAEPTTITQKLLSTVVVPGQPVTITQTIDGVPVTITAPPKPTTVTLNVLTTLTVSAKPITVTQTIDGVPVTVTAPPKSFTVTQIVQAEPVTYTAPPRSVTVTQTVDGIPVTITAPPQSITITKIVDGVPVTVTAPPQSITITQIVDGVPVTVTAPPQSLTITQIVDGVPVTVTAPPVTVTQRQIATQTIIASPGPNGQLSYNFGGGFVFPFIVPGFHGAGNYVINSETEIVVRQDGSWSFTKGGVIKPTGTGTGFSFSFPFSIPGFTGPGTYTLSPGNIVKINSDGTYSFISGGPVSSMSTATKTGGGFTFPFSIPNFAGPGTYTLGSGSIVAINADGSYFYITAGGGGGGATSISNGGGGGSTITAGGGGSSYSYSFGGKTFNIPFLIPNFAGPGTYTLSSGVVVTINADGSYSSGGGGGGGFSYSFGGKTFNFPFSIPNFSGPGTYTLASGAVVTINADGTYSNGGGGGSGFSYSFGGKTFNFPFSIPNFSGPGTYTLSSGAVVTVNADGTYSNGTSSGGGGSGFSYTFGGKTFNFPFAIPNFAGPGTYTLASGAVVTVNADGTYSNGTSGGGGGSSYSYIYDGKTYTFPFSIDNFTGPGIYLINGDTLVQCNSDSSYNYLIAPTTARSNVPTSVATYSGTGIYSLGPGSSVLINSNTYSLITNAPTTTSKSGGFSLPFPVPGFTGPGTYTLNPQSTVVINSDGSYSFLPVASSTPPVTSATSATSASSASVDTGSYTYTALGKTFVFPFKVPNFYGPGTYILGPNLVIQVNNDGTFTYLSGGPSFTITNKSSSSSGSLGSSSSSKPASTTSAAPPTTVNLPTVTYPSIDLPLGQGRVSSYSGAGVYTLNANTVITIDSDGKYSYIKGSGFLGAKTGTLTLPPFAFPTLSLGFGFNIVDFMGPGLYTVSPGNVVSVGPFGGISWVLGGPTPGNSITGNFGFSFPSLTLPPVTLPTFALGSLTITGFTGPGLYTPAPGNIISIGKGGGVSVVAASGNLLAGGSAGATLSIPGLTFPSLNFPTLTLPGGYVIQGYKGPGAYTLSPGTVVSVDVLGGVKFLEGSPQGAATVNLNGAGFTFPMFSFPAVTFPQFSLPTFGFPTLSVPSLTVPSFSVPNIFAMGGSETNFVAQEASASASSATAKPSSNGFVLPGFSLSGFSRRLSESNSAAPSASASA